MTEPEFFSTAAEQSVIGALMLDPDSYHQVQGVVVPSDFYQASHQLIYRAAATVCERGEHPDAITLASELRGQGMLEPAGEVDYLLAIFRGTASAYNARAYAVIVRDFAQRRALIAVLREATTSARHGVEHAPDLLADVARKVESIAHRTMGTSMPWAKTLEAGTMAILAAESRREAGKSLGATIGLPTLDRATGGLQGAVLWCIAGRPGDGKSALALQTLISAGLHGYPCGMLSLEMSPQQIGLRAMSHRWQLPVNRLETADPDTIAQLPKKQQTHPLQDLPIWVDYDTYTLDGIVSRLTEWRRKHEIKFGVVDHIGLIETGNHNSRNDQLGHVSRTLKKTAKALDMPIVALSQLSRSNAKEGRAPALSDLRDSGNIEQDVDLALFIHCPEGPGEKSREIGLLKHRSGRAGWLDTGFTFEGAVQTFREMTNEVYV
ncbi:MAG: replicative DNA helicase [Geminicoccaceae bacterium]